MTTSPTTVELEELIRVQQLEINRLMDELLKLGQIVKSLMDIVDRLVDKTIISKQGS